MLIYQVKFEVDVTMSSDVKKETLTINEKKSQQRTYQK